MLNYYSKLQSAFQSFSSFCFGLDPSADLMEAWGLSVTQPHGLREFSDRVLEASSDTVGILKIQSAFFERYGPDGIDELQRLIQQAKTLGKFIILDCKRGDIGSTMRAYIQSYLGLESPYAVDAMTVHPYLGMQALADAMTAVHNEAVGLFVVLRSSNVEASQLQTARLDDGRTVADYLADQIIALNQKAQQPIGPFGAVVGATLGQDAMHLAEKLSNTPLLVPGLGAQGATIEDIKQIFGSVRHRVIPSSSRAILHAGPSVSAMKQALQTHRQIFSEWISEQ